MTENKIGIESLYIPKEVMALLQNGEITIQESFVLSIIDFLDSKGECFASNDFIAKSIGLKKRRVIEIITNLEGKGYINRTVVYKTGTKEVDKRILKTEIKTTKVEIPSAEKCMGVVQKSAPPSAEKCHIEESIEKSNNNNIYNDLHYKSEDYIFSDMINAYTENPYLVRALEKYIDMRNELYKKDGKKFTERSFKKNLSYLGKFEDENIKRIYKTIIKNSKSFIYLCDDPFTKDEEIDFNKFIENISDEIKNINARSRRKHTQVCDIC